MEKFQREISFISQVFEPAENGEGGKWVEKEVKKTATFKDLSRTDRDQHKLHFKIIGVMKQGAKEDGEPGRVEIDSDALYDLTAKAIKTLLEVNEDFNVQDKNEFLADSGAIFNFGLWLLKEKITPFFSKLMNV